MSNIDWNDNGTDKSGAETGLYTTASSYTSANLTLHDDEGMPIDPMAVANAFDILSMHWTLEHKGWR